MWLPNKSNPKPPGFFRTCSISFPPSVSVFDPPNQLIASRAFNSDHSPQPQPSMRWSPSQSSPQKNGGKIRISRLGPLIQECNSKVSTQKKGNFNKFVKNTCVNHNTSSWNRLCGYVFLTNQQSFFSSKKAANGLDLWQCLDRCKISLCLKMIDPQKWIIITCWR